MIYSDNSSLGGLTYSWKIILIIFFIMSSCQRQVSSHRDDIEMIEVLNKDNPIRIDLYDIVDSISCIPLETNKCLLSDIECIKRDGDFYFVKDSKGLFVFNKEGRFINEISHRGEGPEEYIYSDNFYLDRTSKLVCLLCNAEKKILRYTYDGIYNSSISLDAKDANISFGMMCETGEFIAYFPLPNESFHSESEYSIMRNDNNLFVSELLLTAKELKTQNVYYPFLYYPIASFNNQYYLISALSNEIFIYENSNIVSTCIVDLPGSVPSDVFLEDHKELNFFELTKVMKDRKIGMGITAIEASDNYLFASISNESTLIWDKEKSILIASVFDSNLNLYSDLLLPGGVSDEHLGFYQADFLYEKKDDILKGKNSSLIKSVKKISDEDNPVVYQYFFKKNMIDLLMKKYGL